MKTVVNCAMPKAVDNPSSNMSVKLSSSLGLSSKFVPDFGLVLNKFKTQA